MVPLPNHEPETNSEPIDLDERLGEAIEAYLEVAEAGGPTDPEEFAKAYPDLGDDLVAALEGLALVQGLVGEANGPGHRLEEGRRVAGYRIVRELGRGGMGIVYEAVHVGLDRPVALKVLGTQAAPDSSGRRRFLNEAKTAAGLHHTHIVPVFDVGQVGGLCYYAMQRIEGSGLDRVLRIMRRDRPVAAGSTLGSGARKTGFSPAPRSLPARSRSRPDDISLALSGLGDDTRSWRGGVDVGGGSAWRTREPVDQPPAFTPPRGSAYYRWVAEVGQQAAEALAHAHQRGVIHRDIKPSNLLVDARGMVWVADFGLARRLADPSQTQFDSLLGTPRYMSPEQARTGAIDGRADVYSLGATLYELVTLRPPFDGQSAAELIEQIQTREPARPRRFDPRVPLDLETILLKALAKRPDDRYESADALAEDLARFLAHEPVKARRIGPVGRLVRFAQRHPSLTAVSTTAAALVISTATYAYVRVARERDRAEQAQARTEAANQQLKTVNGQLNQTGRQLRATYLALLDKSAANIQVSDIPDRRSKGLETLHDAAKMDPDPATRVKLRDRALAFLSMRDVKAQPTIPTPPRKQQHGLIFTANGKRIAALSDRGELGIWDVAGRELVDSTSLPIGSQRPGQANGRGGMRGRPGDSRIAAAGEQVAVISTDSGSIGFFDLASPDLPAETLPLKGHHVSSLLASADGRRLLTVDSRPNQGNPNRSGPQDRLEPPEEPRISLWDRDHPESPRATLTLPATKLEPPLRPGPLLLAISPDGSRIAIARLNETEISLWDGQGQPLRDSQGQLLPPIDVQVNATTLALGPAGLLAVAGNGGEIAIWDLSLARPKRMLSLGGHHSFITLLRFSPQNASILAATGIGGAVELWDLSTHSMIAALPTKEWVDDLAFSPDGQTLAAGQASSIAVWSVVEPVAQQVLPETGDTPRSVAFGPRDLLAIASTEATPAQAPSPLRLWGGPGRCPVSVQAWDQVRPSSVGFDDRGRLIAIEPDAIRWFEPPALAPVRVVELPPPGRRPDDRGRGPRADRGKAEGPPGPTSARADGKADGPPGPGLPRFAVRSLDGRTLIVARPNGLLLWRESAPESLVPFALPEPIQGYSGRGTVAALDPSGSGIYYLSRGEKLIAQPIGAEDPGRAPWSISVTQATTLAIRPDGLTIAVAERSGRILLVDAARGSIRETLPPLADDASPIESLAFSPDGRTLAVGAREQIRLWALDGKPRPIVRLPGHRGSVRSMAFDAKGARLAGADEKTIKVWDLAPLRGELAKLGLDW
jgi:serine/threonine protein kinase/WD40 repeat protein